jgi:hypothetical protein
MEIKTENEEKAVRIQLSTHTPEQWRFVDLQSGDVWKWVKGGYFELDPKVRVIGTPRASHVLPVAVLLVIGVFAWIILNYPEVVSDLFRRLRLR